MLGPHLVQAMSPQDQELLVIDDCINYCNSEVAQDLSREQVTYKPLFKEKGGLEKKPQGPWWTPRKAERLQSLQRARETKHITWENEEYKDSTSGALGKEMLRTSRYPRHRIQQCAGATQVAQNSMPARRNSCRR